MTFLIGEWAPYTGQNINQLGMATQIVQAASEAAHLTSDIYFVPWRRAETEVASGHFFGTFPYKKLPNRLQQYQFSEVLFESEFGVLVNGNNPQTRHFKFSSVSDFAGFRIGVVTGTDAVKIPLEQAGAIVSEVPTANQNLQKLAYERLDFVIDDKAVLFTALAQQGDAAEENRHNLIMLDKGFGERNAFRVMVSKRYPEGEALLERFNRGLERIRQNGLHEKILGEYGLKE